MSKQIDRYKKLKAVTENPTWRIIKYWLKLIFIDSFYWIFQTILTLFVFLWEWKGAVLLIIFSFSIFISCQTKKHEIDKCGKIEDMKQLPNESKTDFKNFMWIRYDTGIEKREVNDNSYYNHKKGEFICFKQIDPKYESNLNTWTFITVISGILLVIIGFSYMDD